MILQNAWGLLSLLAIPLLIAIYFILHKYREKTITSTYIWHISDRFERKKIPLSKINQPWILLLQILLIVVFSLALSKPIIRTQNSAEKMCFLLDDSGSMNIVENNKTRFELAKDKITEIVKQSKDGCSYSIILSSNDGRVVLEETENRDNVYKTLTELEPTHTFSTIDSALSIVQEEFSKDLSMHAYFVTDKNYDNFTNIDVIKVGSNIDNYAITDVSYRIDDGHIIIDGYLFSYVSDTNLTVRLSFDDIAVKSETFSVNKMTKTNFQMKVLESEFEKATLEIINEDSLTEDNKVEVYYHEINDAFKTIIVSNNSLYLEAILKAVCVTEIEVISPTLYKGEMGYDLYIFDGTAPVELPTDGGIMMFNISDNILSSGFIYQSQEILENGKKLQYEKGNTSTYSTLTYGTKENEIYISRYLKYSFYSSFTTILSCDGFPAVFAGINENGTREVVFSFDLHDSNMPLLFDFIPLMKNFVEYCVPNIINNYAYECGENLAINVIPQCESIEIISPSNRVSYIENDGEGYAYYTLNELGTYEITVKTSEKEIKERVFVSFPLSESNPHINEDKISLQGVKAESGRYGTQDITFIFLILGLILLLIDYLIFALGKING